MWITYCTDLRMGLEEVTNLSHVVAIRTSAPKVWDNDYSRYVPDAKSSEWAIEMVMADGKVAAIANEMDMDLANSTLEKIKESILAGESVDIDQIQYEIRKDAQYYELRAE